jgi:hypothetical protein
MIGRSCSRKSKQDAAWDCLEEIVDITSVKPDSTYRKPAKF